MADTLEAFSRELGDLVEAASSRVVRVEARRRRPSTGFLLEPGYVVTASHAIERDDDLRVSLDGEREVSAELVGRDPATDVGLLRVPESSTEANFWTDAEQLRVGALLLLVSRPGRTVRASVGIVSALADGWRNAAGARLERYLEADVSLRPGFSGAPILDAGGRLVGMGTSGIVHGSMMVIPTRNLREVVTQLRAHGGIRRGYLGIGSHPIRLQGAAKQAAGAELGLLVSSVEPEGPAEKAGVLVGDVLLGLEGRPTHRIEDLLGVLHQDRIGQTVSAQLLRAGRRTDVQVAIGERR